MPSRHVSAPSGATRPRRTRRAFLARAPFLGVVLVAVVSACSDEDGDEGVGGPKPDEKETPSSGDAGRSAFVERAVAVSCTDDEATLAARGAPKIAVGATTLYVGCRQASATNKDPVVVRFDGGARTWCRQDYETSGDDGTAYGLWWDVGAHACVVSSSTGTQGDASGDFRRYAADGSLPGYGAGGDAKVAVVARVGASDGVADRATFLRTVEGDGKTNSLLVKDVERKDDALLVEADSCFSPLKFDKTPFDCTGGSSPFAYAVTLPPDLGPARPTEAASPRK